MRGNAVPDDSDLTHLGAGVWVNLALFGMVAILYGIAAMRAVDLVTARMSSTRLTIGR